MKIKFLSLLLVLVMLLSFAACGAKEQEQEQPAFTTAEAATGPIAAEGLWKDALYLEDTAFGEGKMEIRVKVEVEGRSVTFTIHTDKETLDEALLEHKLVEGEDGPYGLYVKKVNGILADYDVDQSYWSFCKEGVAQMNGISDEKIVDGGAYELVHAK